MKIDYMICDIIALMINGICACILQCYKFFSALISNMLNVDRYNPLKQNLFGILIVFKSEVVLDQKALELMLQLTIVLNVHQLM